MILDYTQGNDDASDDACEVLSTVSASLEALNNYLHQLIIFNLSKAFINNNLYLLGVVKFQKTSAYGCFVHLHHRLF